MSELAQPKKLGRGRRAVALAAKIVAGTITFSIAAVAGLLLNLDRAPLRRIVAQKVTAILADSFKGRVVIQGIGHLGLNGIGGLDVEIFDPEGRRVILAQGIEGNLPSLAVGVSALLGKGPIPIPINGVHVGYLEVGLFNEPDKTVSIAHTFEPKTPPKPGPPSASRGTSLTVDGAVIARSWIHGDFGLPVIDVDLVDLHANIDVLPEATKLELTRVDIATRSFPNGANPSGKILASAILPADPNADVQVRASYDGKVGDAPISLSGSMLGKAIEAKVDLPRTDPAIVHRLAPDVPLFQPLEAHLTAQGTLTELTAKATVFVGDGSVNVDAKGSIDLAMHAEAKILVKNIDPRAFSKTAPKAAFSASLDATADRTAAGVLTGHYALTTQSTQLGANPIPAIETHGNFTASTVRGDATVHEPGALTTATYDLHAASNGSKNRVVDFETVTEVPSLNGITRVGPIADGAAHVHTKGELALTGTTLKASVDGTVSHLAKGTIGVEQGAISATLTGPVDALTVDGLILGGGIHAGQFAFNHASISARGPVTALYVTAHLDGKDDTPSVLASISLSTKDGFGARGAELKLKHGEQRLAVRFDTLHTGKGTVDVHGLRVDGLGRPIFADVHLAPGALHVKAQSEDIELARIAEFFAPKNGEKKPAPEGHASLDVDVDYARGKANGHVLAVVQGASYGSVHDAAGKVDIELSGRDVKTSVDATLQDAGHLALTSSVTLAGSLLDVAAWRGALGDAKIDGNVDLKKLVAVLPADTLPVDSAIGTVTLSGTIERKNAKTLPDVKLALETKDLDVIGKSAEPVQTATATAVVDVPRGTGSTEPTKVSVPVAEAATTPWHTRDLDGRVELTIDGARDKQDLTVRLFDHTGTLVDTKLETLAPLARLIEHPETAQMMVATAPIDLHLDMPKRDLKSLPPIIKTTGVRGEVAMTADVRGSLVKPTVDVRLTGSDLVAIGGTAPLPLGVDAHVVYDGEHADARVKVSRKEGVVLDSDTKIDLALVDVLKGKSPAWSGTSDSTLTSFPLHTVAPLVDEPIEGCVSGVVRIHDLHRDGNALVDLSLINMRMGDADLPRGSIKVDVSQGKVAADLRLEEYDGTLEAHAKGVMTWGTAVAPSLDKTQPLDADLIAKNFRLAAFSPLVEKQLSEIDGRLDANVKLRASAADKTGTADGFLEVKKGRFEVSAIGQEMKEADLRVTVTPAGKITLEKLSMNGTTGEITGSGSAQLDGLTLRDAEATFQIPEKKKLPITVQGVSYGQAWGNVQIKAASKNAGRDLDVGIEIPTFHIDLPDSATHAVQDLDDDATVTIGAVRPGPEDPKKFVLIPIHAPSPLAVATTTTDAAPPATTRITVKLGEDVRLTKGTQLQVNISGDPLVELGGPQPRVSGKLNLRDGKLVVFGKKFTIENGSVAFNPNDVSNPQIVATAQWESPDGSKVFADYSGAVKTGKLTLRSEPAHTQDEIISLILFGSADGSAGSASPGDESTTNKAAGLGGGVATQGLNKALSNVTDIDVQTSVDTTDSQNPRPELQIQLTRRVMAEVAYNLGLPAPGQNPDRALLILDYRFMAHWSLQTTFGDAGSSLADVIWTYRY